MYIVAENDGGALTLMQRAASLNVADSSSSSPPDAFAVPLAKRSKAGLIAGVVVAVLLVVLLLGVALLYFLKRSNKIFIRLPMYSRHEKRIVLR